MCEFEIAFVVCGHGHDRAGAVAHHHIVGDPHGDFGAIHRVDGVGAGEHTRLVLVEVAAFEIGLRRAGFPISLDGHLLRGSGDFRNERVFGRKHHVGRAEERVGAGGEDSDVFVCNGKDHLGSLAAADPVFLKQLDTFRPIKAIELIDQALGVFRDAQHPLAQRPALDGVAFGFPFLDLFVGEHRAEIGRPPHRRVGDIGEALGIDLLAGPTFGFELRHRPRAVAFGIEVR